MNRKLTALLLAACVSMTATATTFAAGMPGQGAMQQQQQGMNNSRTQQNNAGRNNNGQAMTPANATPDPNATPTPTPDPNATPDPNVQFGMNGGRGNFGQIPEGTEETNTEKPTIEPLPDTEEGTTPNPEERPDKRGEFDPESTPPADFDGATPEPREFDENQPDKRGEFEPETKPENAPENIPENDRDNRQDDIQPPQDNAAPNDNGKANGIKEMAFKDVPSDAWYYENVKKAFKYGFISGDSDDVFNPEKSLSGAELLTMLYKADGNTYTAPSSGEWYEPVTKWAKELKLINDDDEWEFKPDDELSREQMMVILYRYLENKGVDLGDGKDLSEFYDAGDISDYAREAVSRLVGAGYISGSDNKISPRDSLTKAEAVTVIVRTLVNLLK